MGASARAAGKVGIVAICSDFFRSTAQKSRSVHAFNNAMDFLTIAAQNSKSRIAFIELADFLQTSFVASRFRKLSLFLPALYPQKFFRAVDSVNAWFAQSKLDIFNPALILPLTFLGFAAISSYRISNLALASILIGMSFLLIGVKLAGRLRFERIVMEEHLERIAFILLAVGVLSIVYDLLYAGSVPLFDPPARRRLSVFFTMLASLSVPGAVLAIAALGKRLEEKRMTLREARVYSFVIMLGVAFLITLLGFRTQTIVALLSCSIVMYYSRIFGVAEILLSFFSAFFAISAVGYLRATAQGSMIGFFDIIGKRAALTLSVYDYLVQRFWVFGVNHGSTLLATFSSFFQFIPGPRLGPRTIVARIFGVEGVSMTSTLFGIPVLDFGIPGIVAFALVLGFVLGMCYAALRQTKSFFAAAIFSFLLAYALVGIETGLADFNVFMFFAAGAIIIIKSRAK